MTAWLTKAVLAPLAVASVLAAFGASAQAVPPANVLRIELATDIDYVDPALAYYVPTWTIEYATCAMPSVSADGRTYTFQLRDDFFFSPPSNERVTAAHFKYALERALNRTMASPAQPFFSDIVGATDVINGTTNTLAGV